MNLFKLLVIPNDQHICLVISICRNEYMLTMCVYRYRREKKKNICWFCVLTLWAWECICRNEYMLIMWVNVCWLTGPTSLIEVNGLAATYDLWWYVCNRKWEIYFETYLGVMFFAFLLFVAIVNPFFWWPTRSNWGENIPQYHHHHHHHQYHHGDRHQSLLTGWPTWLNWGKRIAENPSTVPGSEL